MLSDQTKQQQDNNYYFPSDICYHIMQFLEWKQIVSCCCHISKDWLSEALRIKFKLINCSGSMLSGLIKSSMNWLQNITELKVNLKDRREVVKELITNFNRMNSLRVLHLINDFEKLLIQNDIAKLLSSPELEQLTDLEFTWGCDFNTAEAIASCSYLRNLERLSIWSDIGPNGISKIATSPYLKNLKHFTFFNSPTVNDCRIISENLTHLESFSLVNCEMASLKYISTLKLKELQTRGGTVCLDDLNVESMANIESIRLIYTQFDISKIKILGSNNFRHLSSISITFNQLYDFNFIENNFSQVFTDKLRKLCLLRIRKGFANTIIKLISKNVRNLTKLSIGEIEDSDLQTFTDNLDSQSCLKTLFLSGKITDKGIAYLTKCNNLTQIDSLTMKNDHCTIISIDHIASSHFSNKIKTLSYSVGNALSDIEKRINNWKSKNLLINLGSTIPRTNLKKRELPNYLEKGQQTLSSLLKKTKK